MVGAIHGMPSRIKNRILKNNGITRRYYAIDPATGALTHTNAQLTAAAVRGLLPYPGFTPEEIECLCCGTTTADLLAPGHGLMVHAELGTPALRSHLHRRHLPVGNRRLQVRLHERGPGTSATMPSPRVPSSPRPSSAPISSTISKATPSWHACRFSAFESDFLRWMISDAAGAVFLSRKVHPGQKALRVDWIDHISYASRLETCMYAGGLKNEDGSITSWRHLNTLQEALDKNYMALKQDAGLLNEEIIKVAVDWALAAVIKKRGIKAADVDWFLPHYSSEFFRDKLYQAMEAIGFAVPYEKWFTNLAWKGNTGSASIFVILEELFHSDRLQEGAKAPLLHPRKRPLLHRLYDADGGVGKPP